MKILSLLSRLHKVSLFMMFISLTFSCKEDENLLETTLPVEFESALIRSGLPYELDGFGGAYHPMQLVIKFKEGVDEAVRIQIMTDILGAVTIKNCMCGDVLTLTTFDQAGLDEKGGLEGIKQKGTDENEIEEITFNYYNFNNLQILNPAPINGNPIPGVNDGENIIAVLDVGVDYGTSTKMFSYLSFNDAESVVGTDDDGNCLLDDTNGWDFINEDNDPTDDHGHGTHVTNIIIDQIEFLDASGLFPDNTRILPIKTHDSDGIGNLFTVSCGMIYAGDRGADIINASWGFYSKEVPVILSQSIEYAFTKSGALLVTSMGNQNFDLNNKNHYPSNLNLSNIIPVGASNNTGEIADFTNYFTNNFENIFSPGVDIESTMPQWYETPTAIKSGTSMAAAHVTAAAAFVLNNCGSNNRNDVLNAIKEGRTLNNTLAGDNSVDFFFFNTAAFNPCP
jgi:subtilisin family serine protease